MMLVTKRNTLSLSIATQRVPKYDVAQEQQNTDILPHTRRQKSSGQFAIIVEIVFGAFAKNNN